MNRWLRHWRESLTVIGAALAVALAYLFSAGALSSRRSAYPAATTDRGRSGRGPIDYRRVIWAPIGIWLVLLIILGGSAASAFLPLGSFNPTINLLLAALMLVVLATFLMDLKRASAVLRLVALAGLFWATFLFALTFTDYLSRRPTLPAAPQALHAAPAATGHENR